MKYFNIVWIYGFFTCACSLAPNPKREKLNVESLAAWAVNNRHAAMVNFAVDSQVIFSAPIDPRASNPDVGAAGSRYRDCGCDFPALEYSDRKANLYGLIQAYQDSQRLHQDTFLHRCENTDAINQAFIIAHIKTADYSKAEIAAILKKWGEPSNQTIGTSASIDTLLRNFKDTSLNRYWGGLRVKNNVFVSNYDRVFSQLQQTILDLSGQDYLYGYAQPKDSGLNRQISEQLRQSMQPADTNTILIADYDGFALYQPQQQKGACAHCGAFTTDDAQQLECLSKSGACLPTLVYRFEIYDKDGFVQLKKKILNGHNLFLR